MDLEESLAKKRDELQNKRLNEMFAEEDSERMKRQEEIDRMLEQDDEVWKEERKKRILGKYAGMERGEIERVVREELEKEKAGECYCLLLLLISLLLPLLMLLQCCLIMAKIATLTCTHTDMHSSNQQQIQPQKPK